MFLYSTFGKRNGGESFTPNEILPYDAVGQYIAHGSEPSPVQYSATHLVAPRKIHHHYSCGALLAGQGVNHDGMQLLGITLVCGTCG